MNSNLISVVFWTLIFSLSTAFSITLLGDRGLISGNLLDVKKLLSLLLNWKFILSMFLAVIARASFVLLNNTIFKIDKFAHNATSIAALLSAFSYMCILVTNYLFLKERLSLHQAFGAFVIILGIFILIK